MITQDYGHSCFRPTYFIKSHPLFNLLGKKKNNLDSNNKENKEKYNMK